VKNKKLAFSIVIIITIFIAAIITFTLGTKSKEEQAYELHTVGKNEKNVLGVLAFNNETVQKEKIGNKYYILIKWATINDHSSKDKTLVKLECTEKQYNIANNLKEGTSIWIYMKDKPYSKAGWKIIDISLSKPDLALPKK